MRPRAAPYPNESKPRVEQIEPVMDGWAATRCMDSAPASFSIDYFLFEVPSNLILARMGARVWIAPWREALVLRLAHTYEQATGSHTRRPKSASDRH
jgi:hypothetical protein